MDFNTILVLISVVALSFLIYRKFVTNHKSKLIEETPASTKLSIENMGAGGVLTLSGVKNGVEDLDLVVSAKHLYKNQTYQWYELIADGGEKSYSIEIEMDDELEVHLSQKNLKLRDLEIKKDQLMIMADEEDGKIQFEGKSYYFDEKGEYTFHRNCDLEKGSPVSLMEFMTEDRKNFLAIEFWNGGETEVTESIAIDPGCIKVYSLGTEVAD
ncbi:MAG: DUF4178 domain-containing protein [Proteobacteria bacterium]|nr:DUF4178 domain-containing protein [Pseudomonadota bacterium]